MHNNFKLKNNKYNVLLYQINQNYYFFNITLKVNEALFYENTNLISCMA